MSYDRPMTERHLGICNLCDASCGIVVEHDGERVLGIRWDADDPVSQGHVCPKALALQDLHEDPDRLRAPVRRVGDRWTPISWDEVLGEVAARMASSEAGALTSSGWNTATPRSTAAVLIRLGISSCFRPCGRSGWVIRWTT